MSLIFIENNYIRDYEDDNMGKPNGPPRWHGFVISAAQN